MTIRFARILRGIGAAALIVLARPAIATGENSGAVTACVANSGRVRIVADAALCRRGEHPVVWNIAGPPGPLGPQGAPGVAGPPGPGFSGIQYYTVGNGDLRPVGGGNFATSFAPPPGGTFSTAAAPLLAGVHLPQHAQVVAIRAHVFDNSASDLAIEFIEQALPGGSAVTVASVASAGAAGTPYSIEGVLPAPHAVDTAQFHYFVRVSPAPGWTATTLQVLGVTIAYTLEETPGS